MKKIPTIFKRDMSQRPALVIDEINPNAQWVFDGEGVATRKYDGMACLIRDGKLYKRFTLRHSADVLEGKTTWRVVQGPEGFEAATEIDPITGKQEGWVPVREGPEDKYLREAFNEGGSIAKEPVGNTVPFRDGTYEFLGEKSQGNPENIKGNWLLAHADADILKDVKTGFDALREYLRPRDTEGIVWHHPDGRMAKIKKKDFGLKRNPAV